MACERLNKSSALNLVRNTDTFLFDCDGVLWNANGLIKGSVETVNSLRQMGKKILYVTNNCARSRAEYAQKLNELGFLAEKADVMCTSFMAASYLNNQNFKGKVFLIGNPSIAAELDIFNIQHTDVGPDPIAGNLSDWIQMELDPNVRCVLVGTDRDFNFMKIIRASRYLGRPDCLFLVTNKDPTHPPVQRPNSLKREMVAIPGTGTQVAAVSCATNRQPILIGKPTPHMFEELRKLHNLNPSRCVMIGDTLKADVGLAKASGIKSLLVLSGMTTEAQLPKPSNPFRDGLQPCGSSTDPPIVPDFYTNSVADVLDFLK